MTPYGRPEPAQEGERRFGGLVQAIAASRDRNAFAELFQHYAPRMKAYLLRTGMAAAAAEELVQDAMLNVWTKAPSFDPARGGVSAWMFTILRNLRHDQLRRQRVEGRWAPDVTDEVEPVLAAESIIGAAERDGLVRKALDALPPEQLQIVAMSFFHHKPQSEIARELNLPLGTIKSRVRLAMKHLRARLAELAE